MRGRTKFSANFYFLFKIFMILLYALTGIMLMFVWSPGEWLPDMNRKGLGIVLLLYAAYRSYRLIKELRDANSIQSNENGSD